MGEILISQGITGERNRGQENGKRLTYLPLSFMFCLHFTLQLLDSVGLLANRLTLIIGGQACSGTEWFFGAVPVFAYTFDGSVRRR